jgi:hypothetical protein
MGFERRVFHDLLEDLVGLNEEHRVAQPGHVLVSPPWQLPRIGAATRAIGALQRQIRTSLRRHALPGPAARCRQGLCVLVAQR